MFWAFLIRRVKEKLMDPKVKNAIYIGGMCALSYLAVYFARDILSVVSPRMIEEGIFATEFVGMLSSVYFICYAAGQLINGVVGDRVKAGYMISMGLILAGICTIAFVPMTRSKVILCTIYGMTGFFLSMIYGPMSKVVAENVDSAYVGRCSLGYTVASFLGSPLVGIMAAVLRWNILYICGGILLILMGGICLLVFNNLQKNGIVRYDSYINKKEKHAVLRMLIEKKIITFTIISIITGVIRTSVVFWLPTYISQYLGFTTEQSAGMFALSSILVSVTPFVAELFYEILKRDMYLTIRFLFMCSALAFWGGYFVRMPAMNLCLIIVAIIAANGVASLIWMIYCPSLRDTGRVSAVSGFLDCSSYVAAAVASTVFANAVAVIGWKGLILAWLGLMIIGVLFAMSFDTYSSRRKNE